MKKLLFILSLLLSLHAFSTTYYINFNAGNDANTGLATGAAWLTLANPNNSAKYADGDTLRFAKGAVWYGNLILQHNHIYLGVYGSGANPLITGFTTVSGWTNLGSNIWESSALTANSSVNIVTINGAVAQIGRTPNTGWYNIDSHSTYTAITSSSLNASVTDWTGAEMIIRKNNFATDRCSVTSMSGSTLSYTTNDTHNYSAIDGYGFYIQNDVRTLDVQNEWYYNPSTKKIRIYSTTSPTNVQATTIDTLVDLKRHDYITFDGLSFTGANKYTFTLPGSNYATIQNCTIDYSGSDAIWGDQNWGRGAANLTVQNSTINHSNNFGIITSNEFTGALFNNNIIKNTGLIDGMGANDGSTGTYSSLSPIISNGAGSVIQYNTIDSCGYSGIVFYGSNDTVRNNNVTNYCSQMMDGGGIYTWYNTAGTTPYTGMQISNNISMNGLATNAGTTNTGAPIDHGIYLDGRSSNIEVAGNTCANNHYSGLFVHYSKNINVHNNNIYNNGNEQLLVASFDASYIDSNLSFKNNKFIAKTASQKCASFESRVNDIATWFSNTDSNYYARPIDDSLTIQTAINNYGTITSRTLAGWQSYSGFDTHSKKSPKTISDTSQIKFVTNTTTSNQTTPLGATYEDLTGVNYTSVTVAPNSSITLLYLAALPVQNNILKIHLGSKIVLVQ